MTEPDDPWVTIEQQEDFDRARKYFVDIEFEATGKKLRLDLDPESMKMSRPIYRNSDYESLKAQTFGMEKDVPSYGDVSPVAAGQDEEKRPKCATHKVFMKYNPAEDRMECVKPECDMVATRNRTFKNTLGAEPEEQPVIYRGGLQYVVDAEGELYLFLTDVNAVVSLERLVDAEPYTADPQGAAKTTAFMSTVVEGLSRAEGKRKALKAAKDTEETIARMRKRQGANMETWPPHIRKAPVLYRELQQRVAAEVSSALVEKRRFLKGPYITTLLQELERIENGIRYFQIYDREGNLISTERINASLVLDSVRNLLRAYLEKADQARPGTAPHYAMLNGEMMRAEDLLH